MTETRTGGCLCGAVRYRLEGEPRRVVHCHCSMCRKATGAPVVTFVSYAADKLTYTQGAPTIRRSSDVATRGFCGACGSALTFRYDDHPDWIGVTAGTLDAPEAIAPELHIYDASRIPWLMIDDGLPRLATH